MNFIKGINRNKITMNCMDELIGTENPVRVIDALVEALNIDELGFAKGKLERVWLSLNFTTQKDLI